MQRHYIDVNAGLGRVNNKESRIPHTLACLEDDMDYFRIHTALVYSRTAKDYSYIEGNRLLLEAVRANARLFGAAVIVPEVKYELKEGGAYLDMLVAQGIRGFKMYPSSHEFSFDPFFLEDIADFMMEKKLPLIVDIDEVSYEVVRNVLHSFRQLKILLCKTYWSQNRKLFKLMEAYDNLYFDISCNQANDILALSKDFFGLDRVLFGTDYPNKMMGGLKALVEYSGLSDEDKNKVAAENAARLFNIDLDSLSIYDENACRLDAIARKVDSGIPLKGFPVIDAHTHMVDSRHQTVSNISMFHSDEDSMIRKMDLLGVDKIVTIPWEGIMTAGDSANDTAFNACEKYPGRIEAYAMYNPNYEEDLNRVLDHYHGKLRFKGIKPYYPKHKIDLLDIRYEKWFEYGDKNSLFILVHSDYPEIPQKVESLSQKYKNLSFILAHAGISYEMARCNVAAARKSGNIYLEITFTSLTNGVIEYMVDELGADRILYGSDMPMRDPAPQLAWVCYAGITVEDKKKILGENMQKLLDRCYK